MPAGVAALHPEQAKARGHRGRVAGHGQRQAEHPARLGRIDDDRVAHHRRVVGEFDLATGLPGGTEPDRLLAFMSRDKKAQGDLTFVLDGSAGVEIVRGIDRADVVATLADMESTASRRST